MQLADWIKENLRPEVSRPEIVTNELPQPTSAELRLKSPHELLVYTHSGNRIPVEPPHKHNLHRREASQ
jgi:hypothetical protein